SAAVMVGIGSAFLDAAGLAGRAPRGFGPMPSFPGDVPEPGRTGAAVLLQVEDDSAAAVDRRLGPLLRDLRALRVAWRTPVSRSPAGTVDGKPLQRNTFGFDEGHGNPAAEAVLITGDAPGWALGGSLLALRVIRLAQDLWAADRPEEQRRVIGRHPDGRWLDGAAAGSPAPFGDDPEGLVTPLDSHVRRMNPRTADEPPPVMLRRSWSYRGATLAGGHPDEGMVFMAFQADLAAGFVRAQQRLTGDALATYLLATGGGYFVVPTADGLGALLTP
ncbi:MAG TPA: Dyp-type peroxidase, partial [Pseudonocardiaceae bacterium]